MNKFIILNLIILILCITSFRIYYTYEKLGYSCTLPIVAVIWAFWITIASIVETAIL